MTPTETDYERTFNEGYKQAENDILTDMECRLKADARLIDGDYRAGIRFALRLVQAAMKRRGVESLCPTST